MRGIAAAVVPACLAACAAAPSDLLESGLQVQFESRLAPSAVVECVGRNAEEFKSFGTALFQASWREGKERGTSEAIVHGGDALGTVVLAVARPSPSGSSVTMSHRGLPVLEIGNLLEMMRKGC